MAQLAKECQRAQEFMWNRCFLYWCKGTTKINWRCAKVCNTVQFSIIFPMPPLMASCHASHPGTSWTGQALDKWTGHPLDEWTGQALDEWIGQALGGWMPQSLDMWTGQAPRHSIMSRTWRTVNSFLFAKYLRFIILCRGDMPHTPRICVHYINIYI